MTMWIYSIYPASLKPIASKTVAGAVRKVWKALFGKHLLTILIRLS